MNSLYDGGREGFLAGDISWRDDDIQVILGDSADYTVDLALHDNLDDIPSIARVAVSSPLTGKTTTAGVADADDVVLLAVTGDVCEFIAIYQETGVEATSRLIGYIDTAGSMPITPNGGDITIQWDGGLNRIFKL